MPRKEKPVKIGPRSGRVSPTAIIGAQTNPQIIRIYNTSAQIDCPVGISPPAAVRPSCSFDFTVGGAVGQVELGTATPAGSNPVEAIYELVPSSGLRSGMFKKPKAGGTVIIKTDPGTGVIYRFFNTHKGAAISIKVSNPADSHSIKRKSSKDVFIGKDAVVEVDEQDVGVYDFLAFDLEGATVESSVRSGHFETAATIIDLAGSERAAVYRIINTGDREISCTGVATDPTIARDSSVDVQVPAAGKLVLSAGAVGSGPIQGSYELLKII
ncbi:MAG: hypothetical protein ACO1RT_16850 [Planctomycetaceae bacterium]